ncbi:DoxX family protein [Pseudonocardia charpentierae]|nr:DoxX family protein [Pseudonocardia sp. DSM 45834]
MTLPAMTVRPAARDALLLVARVLLGVVLIAHGWQKFATYGIAGTAGSFAQMGIPLPAVAAAFAAVVELAGGAALLLGAATVVAGALVVLDMLGAFLLVHVGNGVFVTDGGFELVWAIAAAALVLIAVGPGRFSVDGALASRRRAVTV